MTKDWLGIDDIAEILQGHIDASVIMEFHGNAMIRELLGASGTDYPSWSLRYWKRVAEASYEDGLSPSEGGVFLRALMDRESGVDDEPVMAEGGMVPEPLPLPNAGGISQETIESFAEAFAAALVRHARQEGLFPPREDHLVDKTEAARLLNCSPQAVARRVRPVRPGCWSHVQIQDYLARLRGDRK